MEKLNSIPREQVSDLVDDHLADDVCAQAFEAILGDGEALQTWHTYQVIGDVLRSAELAPTRSDLAFWERLQCKLEDEPARPVVKEVEEFPSVDTSLASVNASVFRWKIAAGVASFAFVGVVGMSLWAQSDQFRGTQMAAQTVVAPSAPVALVAADTSSGTMLRDARLDELMAAHRQLGGHSALQVPAGFMRNATYEGPAR
jgi:sigma-E factor negative regulatory protein RseA